MRDALKDRLRSSLAAGRPPAEAEPRGEALSGDAFLRDFLLKAERVVIPAMAEVGRVLEARGRFASIERIADRVTCRGLLVPASIQLSVFRRHRTVNFKNGAPHFNVVCDRAGRRALFRRNLRLTGAGPEDVGGAALEALTRDLVQEKIADMLEALARQ